MTVLKGSVKPNTVQKACEALRSRFAPENTQPARVWVCGKLREAGFKVNTDDLVYSEHDPDGPDRMRHADPVILTAYRGLTMKVLDAIVKCVIEHCESEKDMVLAEESLCFDSASAPEEAECEAAATSEGWGTW